MLPAITATPGVELAAIASRSAERAASLAERFGGSVRGSYDEVIDDPDIDAVYVPLPIGLHGEWVGRALRAGKHVLSEKSLAGSYADVCELVQLARAQSLVLFENFMCETHPQSIAVRETIGAGGIGDLAHLALFFGFPAFAADDQRNSRELEGGALNDAGAYCLDMAVFYTGRLPVSVWASADQRGADVDQWGSATLHLKGGAVAQLSYGFGLDYRNEVEIWGTSGSIHVDRAFSIPADRLPSVVLTRNTVRSSIEIPAADQFQTQVRRFAETIRIGSGAIELDRRQAHGLIMDSVRRSAAEDRVVAMSEHPDWDALAGRIGDAG